MRNFYLVLVVSLLPVMLCAQRDTPLQRSAGIGVGDIAVSNLSAGGHVGALMSLGRLSQPGPHPAISFSHPCAPNDTAGHIGLLPRIGSSRMFVSRIFNPFGGPEGVGIVLDTMPFGPPAVDIAPAALNLVFDWPQTDFDNGGAILARVHRLRDYLAIGNINTSSLDGVGLHLGDDIDPAAPRGAIHLLSPKIGFTDPPEIKLFPDVNGPGIRILEPPPFLFPLPGASMGLVGQDTHYLFPQVQLLRDPFFPPADQIRLAVSDTTPGIVIRDVVLPGESATDIIHVPDIFVSGSGSEFIGIRFGVKEDPISGDTVPRVEVRPTSNGDHLTISNIGSSGLDGVSIDLGDPLEPTFVGPRLELMESVILPPVIVARPEILNPSLQIGSLGANGLELSLGQPFTQICVGCVPAVRLHTPVLGQAATTGGLTLQAGTTDGVSLSEGGRLTVSNIGPLGDEGVSIDLANAQTPSFVSRIIHDPSAVHSLIIQGPNRYVQDPGLALETEWFYDHLDRRIRVNRIDGPDTLSYQYDPSGRRVDISGVDTASMTSTGNLESVRRYDNLSRVVQEVQRDGADAIVLEYDPGGLRLETSGVDTAILNSTVGLSTRTVYDGLNRQVRSIHADGPIDITERFDLFNSRYDLLDVDTYGHSTRSDYIYIRAFNTPSRTMTHETTDLLSSQSLQRVYDPNAHSVSHLLHQRYSYSSLLNMYCISEFDDLTRLYSVTFSDSNSVAGLRCDYDPNNQSTQCTSDGGLISRYTYDNATRVIARDYEDGPTLMRCEYDLLSRSMSCTSYDSRSYSSFGSMRCTSSFDDAPTSRSMSVLYVDDLSAANLRCVYLPNSQSMECVSSGNLIYRTSYDNATRLVSHEYDDAGNIMRCDYDPLNRTMTCTNYDSRSYLSLGSMRCTSSFDDAPTSRSMSVLYVDEVSAANLRCVYLPNSQSMECVSSGNLVYRTLYDNSSRLVSHEYDDAGTTMRCDYDLLTRSMSCTDYNLRSYTSSGNMHCTSSFDDGARSASNVYIDNNSLSSMSCVYLPNSQTMQCTNIGLRTYSHTSQLLCEYDSRGLSGQVVTETYSDQGTGNSIQTIHDPNLQQVTIGAAPFTGNLHVNGNLSKLGGAFKIDHPDDPDNKYLVHSFVESPDMMNIYNGNVITDDQGYATVELPEYFEALNIDFRYQLTVIGVFAQAIVKEKIAGNKFVIQTNKPSIEVSWQVTGVRNDDYARENRLQVETEKPDSKKGTRLYTPKVHVGLEN